jgi:phosphonate dehydrogenase
MKFKAVVANRLHDPVRTFLEAHADVVMNDDAEPWTNAGLLARCADADAIMVFMTETIDAEFLDACPNLKVVAGALKGYNNIDVAACSARSVAVTIVPDLIPD